MRAVDVRTSFNHNYLLFWAAPWLTFQSDDTSTAWKIDNWSALSTQRQQWNSNTFDFNEFIEKSAARPA